VWKLVRKLIDQERDGALAESVEPESGGDADRSPEFNAPQGLCNVPTSPTDNDGSRVSANAGSPVCSFLFMHVTVLRFREEDDR
jgi:hypothetical protein